MKQSYGSLVPEQLRILIRQAGQIWKNASENPHIEQELLDNWEKLILDWAADKTMPLVVRKGVGGQELLHRTGRKIICADNSTPQWVYWNLLKGYSFSLEEIRIQIAQDKIPFCMMISAKNKGIVSHKATLKEFSINNMGFKLCHINEIGLNTRTPIEEIDIASLEEHFIKMNNPKNMFLVPLELSGLGEVPDFIEAQM